LDQISAVALKQQRMVGLHPPGVALASEAQVLVVWKDLLVEAGALAHHDLYQLDACGVDEHSNELRVIKAVQGIVELRHRPMQLIQLEQIFDISHCFAMRPQRHQCCRKDRDHMVDLQPLARVTENIAERRDAPAGAAYGSVSLYAFSPVRHRSRRRPRIPGEDPKRAAGSAAPLPAPAGPLDWIDRLDDR
jgi:hypothetical protein